MRGSQWNALGALLCAGLMTVTALGQEQARESRTGETGESRAIALPTGNRDSSVILIQGAPPQEIRVGEQFEYELRVSNLTDNMILENVTLDSRASQGLEIINLKSDRKQDQQHEDQKQQERQDQGNQKNQSNRQQGGAWNIGRLMPGETVVAHVTAVGDKEGRLMNCFRVNYEPMACMAIRAVKPELSVGKSAPERASLCEGVQYRYLVRNSGSGTTEAITLRDPLPEGWTTRDGASEVEFKVDRLGPNDSREFDTIVFAGDTGRFGSRATAETQGGLRATSQQPETEIIAENLEVTANGPSVVQVGESAVYGVTVKNTGDIVAKNVMLSVMPPDEGHAANADQNQDEGEQREVIRRFELGDLRPNEAKDVRFRTSSDREMTVGYRFVARSECARERDLTRSDAVAEVRTQIVAEPALLLTAFDETDPIGVGDTTTYRITVINQGTAPAKNVKVTATLPKELEFVEAFGTTEGKVDGKTIHFDAPGELRPKGTLQWRLRAKGASEGETGFRVEVKSDDREQPGIAVEPTTVLGGEDFQRQTGSQREQGARTAKQPDEGEQTR